MTASHLSGISQEFVDVLPRGFGDQAEAVLQRVLRRPDALLGVRWSQASHVRGRDGPDLGPLDFQAKVRLQVIGREVVAIENPKPNVTEDKISLLFVYHCCRLFELIVTSC